MTDQNQEEVEDNETEETEAEGLDSLVDMFDDNQTDADAEESEAATDNDETEKGETEDVEDEETGKTEAESKDETEPETPSDDTSEAEKGLKAALTAERQKRQAAEARLKELQEKKEAPDPLDDPEGFKQHLQDESNQARMKDRINLSRDMMIDSKGESEYLEMEKVFYSLVADVDDEGNVASIIDETLHRKFLAAPNPARFAYNTAVEHLETQRLKSPDYQKQLREEIKAELKAEMEAERKKEADKSGVSAGEVPDLTGATGTASQSVTIEPEVSQIGDVFDDEDD